MAATHAIYAGLTLRAGEAARVDLAARYERCQTHPLGSAVPVQAASPTFGPDDKRSNPGAPRRSPACRW
ncbi:MAG TPA: hypothetical protein VMQ93_12165 [Novosphingobium sp.]|nr:hypothetical protein [Novosphingobium sp.]